MVTSDSKILVLGLGNTLLSDEAVGVRVVENLQNHPDAVHHNLKLMDGGTMGLTLLVDMEDADAIIILDAGQLGTKPGCLQVFEGEQMDRFLRNRGRNPHDIGLDDLMDGLRLRQAVPDKRALICIQPKTIAVGEHLSNEVEQAVPQAVKAVFEILNRWTYKQIQ